MFPKKERDNFWYYMLKIDCLKLYKFFYYILGPIFKNKGTLKGTYSVLKNIFGGDNRECRF